LRKRKSKDRIEMQLQVRLQLNTTGQGRRAGRLGAAGDRRRKMMGPQETYSLSIGHGRFQEASVEASGEFAAKPDAPSRPGQSPWPVVFSCSRSLQPQLRSAMDVLRLESMTTFNSFRHAHSHHGLTGRGALLRVQVRL
jgi:hypothetical protein